MQAVSTTFFPLSLLKLECTCLSLEAVEFDPFAAKWFHECLYELRERASFYIGMSSLLFWFLCMIPQLVKHYRRQTCEGIAGLLLAFWLLGDSLNLAGAILTKQLAFQQMNAATFCLMDLAMIFQFFYYGTKPPPPSPRRPPVRTGAAQPLLPATATATAAAAVAVLACIVPAPAYAALEDGDAELIPLCQQPVEGNSNLFSFGSVLGWVSALCYLSSRLSQIYNNHLLVQKRQPHAPSGLHRSNSLVITIEVDDDNDDVEGEVELSGEGSAGTTMFLFAIAANGLYSLGILLNFKPRAVPWLMGSLCVMFLDVVIVMQERDKISHNARVHRLLHQRSASSTTQ